MESKSGDPKKYMRGEVGEEAGDTAKESTKEGRRNPQLILLAARQPSTGARPAMGFLGSKVQTMGCLPTLRA